jgi:hypothetical protein
LNPAIEALVSGGVLSCPEVSGRAATLAFKPEPWKRYSETESRTARRDAAVEAKTA